MKVATHSKPSATNRASSRLMGKRRFPSLFREERQCSVAWLLGPGSERPTGFEDGVAVGIQQADFAHPVRANPARFWRGRPDDPHQLVGMDHFAGDLARSFKVTRGLVGNVTK